MGLALRGQSKNMTVFQYLQTMSQPLFEATLLGLMGFPVNPEREGWIHQWMNEPYDKWFSKSDLSTLAGDMTVPLDHMTMLLGKTAETLPKDEQEKLSHAMREYCEVCDYINNQLTEQQNTERK